MAEPLSVTTSILGVICFATQSCQFLHGVFQRFADAPKDIQQQLHTLQALSSTLERIKALGEEIPPEVQWPIELDNGVQNCLTDLQKMEAKMGKMSKRIEKGRIQRTWTRLWWLSNTPELNVFFTRVQTYQATFALDLVMLQM